MIRSVLIGRKNRLPSLGMVLLSITAGWLSNRSFEIPQALISGLIGGGLLWLFLASPISQYLYNYRVNVLRYIAIGIGIVSLVYLQKVFVPWLMGLVANNA